MPREMLQNLVLTGNRNRRGTRYLIPLSAGLHALLLTAAIILPLFADVELPAVARDPVSRVYVEPPSVVLPRQPVRADKRPPRTRVQPRDTATPRIDPSSWAAPIYEPEELDIEESLFDVGWEGGVEGGVPCSGDDCLIGAVLGDGVGAAPPPPAPVRVGGHIEEPVKLRHVAPVYPDIAKLAGVQGLVILECTISAEGRVTNVRVLRGTPLLDQAAIEAVKEWVYTPTLLNAQPVPVVMTVTVRFTLS